MKKSIRYLFIFSAFIGFSIYILEKLNVSVPKIIRFYVNDFLIIPIVLSLSLMVVQKLQNNKTYTLPLTLIVFICTMYAIFFEYFLPQFNPRYTSDSIDVSLYFLGGLVFYFFQIRT